MLVACTHVYLAIYIVVRITVTGYHGSVTQKYVDPSTCDVSTMKDFIQVTLNIIS